MNGEKWNDENACIFPKAANDLHVNLTFEMSAMARSPSSNTASQTSGGKDWRLDLTAFE
jgi:hypothetical protein